MIGNINYQQNHSNTNRICKYMIFATDNVALVTVHIKLQSLQYLRNLSQIDVVYLR